MWPILVTLYQKSWELRVYFWAFLSPTVMSLDKDLVLESGRPTSSWAKRQSSVGGLSHPNRGISPKRQEILLPTMLSLPGRVWLCLRSVSRWLRFPVCTFRPSASGPWRCRLVPVLDAGLPWWDRPLSSLPSQASWSTKSSLPPFIDCSPGDLFMQSLTMTSEVDGICKWQMVKLRLGEVR